MNRQIDRMDEQTKQADGQTVRRMEQTDRWTNKCTDRKDRQMYDQSQTEWCTEWMDSVNKDDDTKGCIFKTTMNCVCGRIIRVIMLCCGCDV